MSMRLFPLKTKGIRTKRLVLRPHEAADADLFYEHYSNDRQVSRSTGSWHVGQSLTKVRQRMSVHASPLGRNRPRPFTIMRNGELIGGVGALPKLGGEFSLGYWIKRQHWGKGYASEAARASLKYAFEELGAKEVTACAAFDNKGSNRILQKLGFQETHRKKSWTPGRGHHHELIFYKLTKGRFERLCLHVLRTQRLVLRPVRTSDAPQVAELLSSKEVSQLLARIPYPYELSHAYQWVKMRKKLRSHYSREFMITIDDDQLLGVVGIGNQGRGPTLGYWIGKEYWGKGYMSEAANTVIDWFFEKTEGMRNRDILYSGAFEENAASLRVQEKLGFTVTSSSTLYSLASGSEMPHLETELTRDAYERRKNRTK